VALTKSKRVFVKKKKKSKSLYLTQNWMSKLWKNRGTWEWDCDTINI